MTKPPGLDWRDLFCGRMQELAVLSRLYDEVAAGRGPRVCVVLGDRGMGKTRLVQEFYRHLSTSRDPLNYWPDASLFAGSNLRVAPELDDPVTHKHFSSFVLDERPMPFLWWGFRLTDPVARNAAIGGLAAHRSTLDLHLVPALFSRGRSNTRQAMKQAAREHGAQLGKKAVLDIVKLIPAIGAVATAFEWGVELAERAGLTAAAAREARGRDQHEHESSLAGLGQERTQGLLENTLDELATLLTPRDGLSPLPTVVFCDDAQFAGAGGDEGALRLLDSIWERAHLGGWPVLLVMTHWAVEWHQRVSQTSRDEAGRLLHLAGGFERAARSAQFGALVELRAEPELVKLVRNGIEGLPLADEQLLLSKADGNPQLLVELIELVRRSPAWRPHGKSGLSAYARGQIENRSSSLVALIRERLESDTTPPSVRQAVALSSVQGLQFLCALTHEAAQALQIAGSEQALPQAQHPHRLVVGVEMGVAGFVQRAYREAAESLVGQHLGDPDLVRAALLRSAIDITDNADRWVSLRGSEKSAALAILVELGENDAQPEARLHAGRALLKLVSLALNTQRGADFARAAGLASRFESGLGSRWPLSAFPTADLVPVFDALRVWHGAARVGGFSALVLAQARANRAVRVGADIQREVFRWAYYSGLAAQAQGHWNEAETLYREGLEITRLLVKQLGTHQARRDVAVSLYSVGLAAEERGHWTEAEARYRECLAICRRLAAHLDTPEAQRDVCLSLWHLGCVAEAHGRWDEAEALHRESLAGRRRLAERLGTPQALGDVFPSIFKVGAAAKEQGRWYEAETLYREGLAISRELAKQLGTPTARRDVAVALSGVAEAAKERGLWDEAETLYRESLAISRELAEQLGTPEARSDVCASLRHVGSVAQLLSQWDEAEALYRESLGISRELATQLGTPAARRDVCASLWEVGVVAQARARWDEAETLYRECLDISRELATELGTPQARRDLWVSLWHVGEIAQAQARWDDAEALFRESLVMSCELANQLGTPEARGDVAALMFKVSQAAQAQARLEEAETLYRESLAIYRELADQLGTPRAQHNVGMALRGVALVAKERGFWTEAETLFRESLAICREVAEQLRTPKARLEVEVALNNVGKAAQEQGRWKEAEALYRESLGMSRERAEQLGTPQVRRRVCESLGDVGNAVQEQGRWNEAEALYRESLGISRDLAEQLRTPRAWRDVCCWLDALGKAVQEQGRWEEAEALYRESLGISRELAEQLRTPEARRDVCVSLGDVGKAVQEEGRWEEAEALYRESLGISRELAEQLGTPQALRDVCVSLDRVGVAAQAQGRWDEAETLHSESLVIGRRLAEQLSTPQALRDVADSMQNLSAVYHEWRRRDDACALLAEARMTLRKVTEQVGTPDVKDELELIEKRLREYGCPQPIQ